MSSNTSSKIAVSVIIPIGKTETYLARCLDSVLSQTLLNIEVILVNICSDIPSSICAKYANQDKRIKVLNKNFGGYGVAFNAGLTEAAGEYIAFVDSCDWLEPEMYDVLYEIASDQGVDLVHSLKYSNNGGSRPIVSNPFTNAFANPNKCERYVNEKSDYKFFVPMLLFYSEDLYSSIYRKGFLTDNKIKFSEIPGSNAQNLGFTFLVFCHLGSFYIHEAALYHLNPNRTYYSDKSFKTVVESAGEYKYIKSLIEQRKLEDRYIEKRYLHIAMAKIFRQIRHRYLIHCKSIKQKTEFLKVIKPFLIDYYPLKNDNMFLNRREKRLYKRLLRHPLKTSITYSLNKEVMRLSKKLLTDISFHSNHKQIRIFGFRFFFYKKTTNYSTFNLCHLPIIRRRKHSNIEENSITTYHYFLGMLCAKDVERFDWRKSAWYANRKMYNPTYIRIGGPIQWGLDRRVTNQHGTLFTPFKNTNKGLIVKIFGNGVIFEDSLNLNGSKIIACNKDINIFGKWPDYIFASDHIESNRYYNKLIESKCSHIFFDKNNIYSLTLAKRSRQSSNIEHLNFYYGLWRFYDEISEDIASAPLAFFGDTVHSAIHFALYTNPDVIYLIGCDIYDEGVRKNNRQFAATGKELMIGYKKLRALKDAYYPNTKIVCVNPIGLKGIFDEQYTDEYLKCRLEKSLVNGTAHI